MGVILVAALADQVDTSSYISYNNYKERAARFAEDEESVKQVESALPMNAMVFQLPNTPFPAEAPPGKMSFYDHARAYLHSHRYRWSWAGMMGRKGEWTRETASMPSAEMLNRLTAAGFSGLWLDLNGYESGKSPEADITRLVGAALFRVRGGRVLFYDLRGYSAQLRQTESPAERARTLDSALYPVEAAFPEGFSIEESYSGERWRWSDRTGRIVFRNPQDRPRQVIASMDLQTGYTESAPLTITGGGKTEILPVGAARETFSRQLTIPAHGETTLSFSCACRKIIAPDPRSLYFRIWDFTIHE
jgi:hypothetical protein